MHGSKEQLFAGVSETHAKDGRHKPLIRVSREFLGVRVRQTHRVSYLGPKVNHV